MPKEIDIPLPLTYYLNMDYQHLTTIEQGKRGGRPSIRGLHIAVYDVVPYLAAGMTTEELLDDSPIWKKKIFRHV